MSGHVGRFGVGAGLVSGAVAVAVTLGLGGAYAGAADQLAGVVAADQPISLAAASESADSIDLLIMASTNFVDANDIITGIDTSELSDSLLRAVESMQRVPGIMDRVVTIVDDTLVPGQSAILEKSGSMSSLIDQLFFEPLNQRWLDTSESMLGATQAFDDAVADGSLGDAMSAQLQVLGLAFSDLIPTAFMSIPVMWIASIFGDVVGAWDLVDFSV